MKKFCLFLSIVLLLTTFSGVNENKIFAVAAVQNVKVGLFYKDTAKSQVDISADKGLVLGSFDAATNTFQPAYASTGGEVIRVLKDSYYNKSGAVYTASDAGKNPAIGPYHIKIQDTYATYNDAVAAVQVYKQKGVDAYPTYTDTGWNVWTGFYFDQTIANNAIADIRTKLGENTYTLIQKLDTRVFATSSSTGSVLFMYACTQKLLRAKAATEGDVVKIAGIGKFNSFRGQLEFFRKTGSDMTIINVLPLEEYLYGVVPSEIGGGSPKEALKAQAIASRTYTYRSLSKHKADGFNLCSTEHCHVYKGKNAENVNSNQAIDDTKNMVVTYNSTLAETLYFAYSGGQTEDSGNVWNSVPYLKSVTDNYESKTISGYNWKTKYTVDELSQLLKSRNLDVGTVTSVDVTKVSAAGRPIEIVIKGTSKPNGITITKDRCRTAFGLKSQWYSITTNSDVGIISDSGQDKVPLSQLTIVTANGETKYTDPSQKITIVGADGTTNTVSPVPTEYYFDGKGWGHSVGMSQEGAKGMAYAGFTYEQILTHYYTGTKIELVK